MPEIEHHPANAVLAHSNTPDSRTSNSLLIKLPTDVTSQLANENENETRLPDWETRKSLTGITVDSPPVSSSPVSVNVSSSRSSPTCATSSTTTKTTEAQTSTTNGHSDQEIYAIDAGVILCICGFTHDDGFTIQCEKCNVWQHAVCVNIGNDEVPDIYLCNKCGDKSYDTERARKLQARRVKRLQASNRRDMEYTNDTHATDKTRPNSEQPESKDKSVHNSKFKRLLMGSTEEGSELQKNGLSSTGMFLTPTDSRNDTENESDRKSRLAQKNSSYYVPISHNRYSQPSVRRFVEALAQKDQQRNDIRIFTVAEYHNMELPDVMIKLTSDHPKQKFGGFSQHGLFSESYIPKNNCVINYLGEVMMQEHYKSNHINQYREFGCPKPGVFFHPSLPICIDARLVGSQARFIRKSCRPNCEVQTVVIDNHVNFIVFSTEDINPGSELTLAWTWDPHHPVQKLLASNSKALTASERLFLVSSAYIITQRGAHCACKLNQNECVLAQMKKINGTPRVSRASTKPRRGMPDAVPEPESQPQLVMESTESIPFQPYDPDQYAKGLIYRLTHKKPARKYESITDNAANESTENSVSSKKAKTVESVDKAVQTDPPTQFVPYTSVFSQRPRSMLSRYIQVMNSYSKPSKPVLDNAQSVTEHHNNPAMPPFSLSPTLDQNGGKSSTDLTALSGDTKHASEKETPGSGPATKEVKTPSHASQPQQPTYQKPAAVDKSKFMPAPQHPTAAPASSSLPSPASQPHVAPTHNSGGGPAPKPIKKKLSFADYKRKQISANEPAKQ